MNKKFAKFSIGLLFGAVMLMAATSFAADKTTLQITNPVTVNGNQLSAGEYTLTWEGTGPSVELKFMKGKKLVTSVPAQIVKLNSVNAPGSFTTRKDNDQVILTQIRPNKKNYALAIGGEAVAAADSAK